MGKMTPAEIAQLIEFVGSQDALAELLGCHQSTISRALQGDGWKQGPIELLAQQAFSAIIDLQEGIQKEI